jgi:hypothetical protein
MSEAFTHTTEHGAAQAAAPGGGAGRHRGPLARDDMADQAERSPMGGHGRHRRPGDHIGPWSLGAAEA